MRKKFKDLIELSNSELENYRKQILEYTKYVDPMYVITLANTLDYKFHMSEDGVRWELKYIQKSSKKMYEKLIKKSAEMPVKYNKIIVELDDLKNKVDSHRREFYEFVSFFASGFVTLRKISNNSKEYLFVENLQVLGEDRYALNGISTDQAGTISIEIDPRVYIVSKMTRTEFDEEYFPARIRRCGITNESELVKYGAELTELFEKFEKLM